MVVAVFARSGRKGMRVGEMVRALTEEYGVGESTAWRALGRDGYGRAWLTEAAGIVALKEDKP